MRTEQVTIYPQKFPNDPQAGDSFNSLNGEIFGPAFRRPFFEYVSAYQLNSNISNFIFFCFFILKGKLL